MDNLIFFSLFFLDIVESYKHLVKEKEVLEVSIKSLTDVEKSDTETQEGISSDANDNASENVRII